MSEEGIMGPQAAPDDLALERFRRYLLSLARLKPGGTDWAVRVWDGSP
jgi:hypothetical protein